VVPFAAQSHFSAPPPSPPSTVTLSPFTHLLKKHNNNTTPLSWFVYNMDSVIATLQNFAQDPIPAACVAVGGLKLLGVLLGVSS
jgi:hypothetical protein